MDEELISKADVVDLFGEEFIEVISLGYSNQLPELLDLAKEYEQNGQNITQEMVNALGNIAPRLGIIAQELLDVRLQDRNINLEEVINLLLSIEN